MWRQAALGHAHPMLDLGEGLLDRIEVRRIGRQVPEPGTGSPDDLSQHGRLVAAEVVHDDDVARLENGNQLLLDIGSEALAVDRTIEHARSCEAVAAQRAEEGQRPPVAMWGISPQTIALAAPSAQRRHAGLDPGLVDEHQAPWIEAGLPGSPALSPAGDVGASLLKREQCFF